MATRLTLSALATVLGLGLASEALADDLQSRRERFKPVEVADCPTDDDKFWSHWATARGYEHILNGDLEKAAVCYGKADQMFRKAVSTKPGDNCWICDGYGRVATILREIPRGAINPVKETFEKSAKRALQRGNGSLAAKLYELTALGYARLGIEGNGRFDKAILHRESRPWQDSRIKAGYFFEAAAGLVTKPTEKRRLLQQARDVNFNVLLDTGHCSYFGSRVRNEHYLYNDCKQAQKTVARLDKMLK